MDDQNNSEKVRIRTSINKEINMSTKTSFKFVTTFGTVALLLMVLGLYFVPRASAGNKASIDNVIRLKGLLNESGSLLI